MARSAEARMRDGLALEYRRDHMGYREIAAAMGWASPSSAYEAVQRALSDLTAEAGAEVRAVELERLDKMAQAAQEILAREHHAYSAGSGRVVVDPVTGQRVLDDAPALAAIDRLLKIMDRRSKYLGLDAPAKTQMEVTTVDSLDAKLQRLADQVAGLDETAAGPVPDGAEAG